MTTREIIDGLEMLCFFNQRAGRELWGDKPKQIQDKDIEHADRILRSAISALEELNNSNQEVKKSNKEVKKSNDLIGRQDAIDAVTHITSSMSVCVNADECHGMKRMQRQAVIELANLPSAQPESTRTFVELVVEYPDPELCTYKEYKGKPYFSIKYIENGEGYIGYGTYSPKVLSRYLREYFIEPEQTRTQMSLSNCISRQAAIDALSHMMDTDGFRDGWAVSRANVDCMLRALPSAHPDNTEWKGKPMSDLIERQKAIDVIEKHACNTQRILDAINALPSAQPQPKTGEWNFVENQMYECTNCGVAYTEYQFEKMRVRYNDPKFPKFCPNCGSYNGGDSDDQ